MSETSRPDHLVVKRGCIDIIGWHRRAGGWLICGWIPGLWQEGWMRTATCRIDGESRRVDTVVVFHQREGVYPHGTGAVILLDQLPFGAGQLESLTFEIASEQIILTPTPKFQHYSGDGLIAAALKPLALAEEDAAKAALLERLVHRRFEGRSTLGELSDDVRIEIDTLIACPPGGLVLIGWMLSDDNVVRQIRLRSGAHATMLPLEQRIRIPRPGVIDALRATSGFTDERCGFMLFMPEGYNPGFPTYLEIETQRGQIAYKTLPAAGLRGLPAMERILGECDAQFGDLAAAFDHVLGPAIQRLQAVRLGQPNAASQITFGTPVDRPTCSLVVPLYGRIDYLEVQVAFLSADPFLARCELIYVLDDPRQRRVAENLCASLYARFQLPIRLIILDRNVGFAPASNIGLRAATGQFVCFLNSDVFPTVPGWLMRLCARLEADPGLGVVAPMLLHDDDTVQHLGATFRKMAQFGGWYFADHPGKGRKPPEDTGLHRCASVTGACMVMARALAVELGGFDEQYAVGDFEDSDLCLRLHNRGLAAAVDYGERLYHLEHKSQLALTQRWRMNLTLFNAWVHQRRWGETIAGLLDEHVPDVRLETVS